MANDKTYDRHVNIWINGKEVKNDISSIRKEMFNLTNEVGRTTRGTEEYKQKVAELQKVKQILKEHQQNISDTGGAWNKVKGLFSSAQGVFIAGIAGITTAYQSLKGVITSTDALGDAFEKTVGGWKGGLDALARSLATITEGGLKNLGKKIREGIDEGRRYAETLDTIDENTRALQIAEAKAENEILKQTLISRDATKSKEEQIAAGKRIIEIEDELTQIRTGIAHQGYLNESKNIQNITHLTEEEILAYASKEKGMVANIEAGKKYNELVAERRRLVANSSEIGLSPEEGARLIEIATAVDNATEATKRFAYAQANMPGDEKMWKFTRAVIEQEHAINSGMENTMRTRVRVAKNEEALDKAEEKRQKDDLDLKERAEKYTNEYFQNEQKRNQKDLEDIERMERYTQEYFDNEQKRNKKDLQDKELMEKWTDEYFKKEYDRELIDLENRLTIKGNNAFAIIDLEKQKNEILKREEIDAAEETGASVQLINEKYAKLDQDLDEKKKQTKLSIASEFFGNVATIAGKQSAIGKAAAVTQTTIDTYASATASYKALAGIPVIGPALGFAAAAAAIAAGLMNVRSILKVNTNNKWTGGYAGDGGKYEAKGMYHGGEYIVPKWQVASPEFRPMVDALEQGRVNGGGSMANGGSANGSMPSTAAGGSSSVLVGSNPKLESTLNKMNLLLNELRRNGVKTVFGWNEADNVKKGLSKLDDIENQVTM